ncbi:MAG: phosphatidylglycerophosphatase A [Bdellovibrionales bacterium]|nr:phosphatidylglycerophosphatase A [Bdellovibrionales bacterium]
MRRTINSERSQLVDFRSPSPPHCDTLPSMKSLKGLVVSLIVTAGGAGFSAKAPGTVGTLVGVLIVFLTRDWSGFSFGIFSLALFFSGWWASLEWSRNTGLSDSQRIVIDEVLGYFVATAFLPREPIVLATQFLLFRFFDVLKPPPVRQIDHWGKRFPIGPIQSLGVILDDIAAGVLALGVALLLQYFQLPPFHLSQ